VPGAPDPARLTPQGEKNRQSTLISAPWLD
jgi:hypothetical protein